VSWSVFDTYGWRFRSTIRPSTSKSLESPWGFEIGNEIHSSDPVFIERGMFNSGSKKQIQSSAFNEDPAALMNFTATIGLQKSYHRMPGLVRDFGQVQYRDIAVSKRGAQIFDLALFFCKLFGITNDLGLFLLNAGLSLHKSIFSSTGQRLLRS
jgi:hypothetical protein